MLNDNPLTKTQEAVLEIIMSASKSKPVTSDYIMDMVGVLKDPRGIGINLRAVVNILRDKGYAICAGSRGYYSPSDPQELREYIEAFEHRIDEQIKSLNALKIKYNNWAPSSAKRLITKPPEQMRLGMSLPRITN